MKKLLILFLMAMIILNPAGFTEDLFSEDFLDLILGIGNSYKLSDYEELYFRILDISSGPDYDEKFSLLPESAQHLYVAAIFDMEIQNGGICQFFVNCGPAYAVRVSDALYAVGMKEIAAAYQKFVEDNNIDIMVLEEFKVDPSASFGALYDLYPFDEFDSEYTKLWGQTDFNHAMLEYAKTHPEALE